MTIARDRTIGILFGDLVVAIVFTQIWPVTIAGRIDPAIRGLLRQLAAIAAPANAPRRWRIAAEARASLAAIEQDLALAHYEPLSIRPAPSWLEQRRDIVGIVSSLQGPLLIGGDQDPLDFAGAASRLDRLAAVPGEAGPPPRPTGESGIAATIEAPLAKLERLVTNLSEDGAREMENHASA